MTSIKYRVISENTMKAITNIHNAKSSTISNN